MKIILAAKGLFDRIIFWCAVLSTISIVIIMVTNMLDTIMRWLKIPIYGIYELNSLLVGITIFLGLALVQQRKKHISVNLLSGKLPGKVKHVVATLVYLLGVVFFAYLSYWYGVKAYISVVTNEVIPGIVKFPVSPLKIIMCLGLVLLTIQLIIDTIVEVEKLLGKRSVEPTHAINRIEMEVSGL